MKAPLPLVAGLLLAGFTARDAAAQWNVARFDRQRDRLYTSFGLDPAFVATVGYGRVVPLFGHPVQLAGDAGVATARLDVRDFRARLTAHTSIVHWRSLHLTGSATFLTRGTENTIYRGFNFGADLTGSAGVYRPRWFAAGEFGFDKAIVTHITHSDWYRRNFYPEAKDGWYLTGGGTYHYGVSGGLAVGRVELVGRAGWRRNERWDDVMPPMYATVGMGIGL